MTTPQDATLFLLNRGQCIDPTVGSLEAAMEAIDSVLKTAPVKHCGACKVTWTAPMLECPECGTSTTPNFPMCSDKEEWITIMRQLQPHIDTEKLEAIWADGLKKRQEWEAAHSSS